LVDPGVTAQLECLLDDVVVGKQEMVGAIDAVCDVAERIIGRLKESATAGGTPLRGDVVGTGAAAYPPTPAMKRFADSLSRKGIKPPPGYKTSISICRKFLSEYAPKKADGEALGKIEPKPVSPTQMLYAKKIALGKGVVIPDEAKANAAAISTWIDSNRLTKRRNVRCHYDATTAPGPRKQKSLPTQGGGTGRIPSQPALASLQELLGPAVIHRGGDALATAQLRNTLLAAQPLQHNADLLFRRILPAGLTPNVLQHLFGRRFIRPGFLFHLRSLRLR
jgi:hypothetical protein